jgi:hypothetical protein
LSGSLKSEAQISPRKLGGEEVLSSRECVSKCIQVRMSGQTEGRGEGRGGGGLYSPQGNLPVGAVRDPDMSGSGARLVRPTSLEFSCWTGHVRSRDLAAEESG